MHVTDQPPRPEAHILLVDDDPIMCELAENRLTEAGYQVRVAHHGEDAIRLMEDQAPDLVISDIDMPVMDGFALTRFIRASNAFHEIPVIVITASDRADVAGDAFEAGATSFLDKPINWTLFSHAVRFVLRASWDRKALQAAKDQAEAGARFKDSLMSVMSHELRTPLNAIIGFGQLLREKFDAEKDHLNREYADYVIDGGRRLLNSVSDMLLASDARSGPIALNEVDVTLEDIVDLAVSYAQKEIELSHAELKINVQDAALELRCDRLLVARAVSKLIDNAIKFSSHGVHIMVAALRTKDGRLALIVRDNGPGIATEKLATISAPFTQSDMSLRRSKEGLGLGLPLVKAITLSHGGKFHLTSPQDYGAQAIMLFPEDRIVSGGSPINQVSTDDILQATG
ncbi:MAG: hybrid sensor histidine kinase/response regulator [Pseudomonadota bacterium]